eukprot:349644-Chlamydomonas_euryale.AAC.9
MQQLPLSFLDATTSTGFSGCSNFHAFCHQSRVQWLFWMQQLPRLLPSNQSHCKDHHLAGLDLDQQRSPATGPILVLDRVAEHNPLPPRRALDHVIRSTCWFFLDSNGARCLMASRQACLSNGARCLMASRQACLSNGARCEMASRQACLSKAHPAAAARVSGEGTNQDWPDNSRKS